ncbi:arabinose efflux permease family protein [Actinobacteria bacterium IMCC26256]|nr:arabinose efflux permease family protein [Actinobacteria bacterium IMCC26256]
MARSASRSAPRPGTAGSALRHRDFRIVWAGTFTSNIGTWMQNVLLGAWGWELTHSATYVGILYFAQLGPLLLLSVFGGVLADVLDRRRLLVITQLEQLVGSLVLAVLAMSENPPLSGIALCVLAIGIGNAFAAPSMGAIMPTLVPREDIPGSVSLQSVQMNLSRVIGPAIGAPLYAVFGAAPVFAINAATYLFAIVSLMVAKFPRLSPHPPTERGLARLSSGFRIAWNDPLVKRILITLTIFSFFSLTFVGLMPAIAAQNFGIRPKSTAYGALYAVFGFGAAMGAISVGTILHGRSKERIVRFGLIAFALLLAIFACIRTPFWAFPAVCILGFAYFAVITALSTVLQSHLDNAVRGRVMALWIMAFGGTVPIGVLFGGWIENLIGITAVMLYGAVVALCLAYYSDLANTHRAHSVT